MEGNADSATPVDDLSVEQMLEMIRKKAHALDGEPVPQVSLLGAKGENRHYLIKTGEGQLRMDSYGPNETVPEGAKEITWEQACEALICIRFNTEQLQKSRELCEKQKSLERKQGPIGGASSTQSNAVEIFDPKACDFYIVVFTDGGVGGVTLPKGVLPSADAVAKAEKVTYSEYKRYYNQYLKYEQRKQVQEQLAKHQRKAKQHYLFWMLFGYLSRQLGEGVGNFLSNK